MYDLYAEYERYKRYLQSLNLPRQEHERRLREWCIANNF